MVEAGSFSAAARTLALTPSAVARSVDRIEARLGVRLLLRSTRALTLTAEGQAYLLAARRILADLDDAEQQIADQIGQGILFQGHPIPAGEGGQGRLQPHRAGLVVIAQHLPLQPAVADLQKHKLREHPGQERSQAFLQILQYPFECQSPRPF